MKKFTVPCRFGDTTAPFDVYIGRPAPGLAPLRFQERWLAEMRGGELPAATLDSFARLLEIADRNEVSFEELCVYALEVANQSKPGGSGP